MTPKNLEPNIFDPRCPSRSILRDITGRWAPMILLALDDGLSRFGDLHRHIGGSNERMLSQTLSTLTEDGMVTRTLDSDGRPDYTLTDDGRDVVHHLRGLRDVVYAQLNR